MSSGRTLRHLGGYTVRHVMNFTDVDDRTIIGSEKAGKPLREYTNQWIDAFLDDARALGLEDVEERPRATDEDNLQAMASLVRVANRQRPYLRLRRIGRTSRFRPCRSTAVWRGSITTA